MVKIYFLINLRHKDERKLYKMCTHKISSFTENEDCTIRSYILQITSYEKMLHCLPRNLRCDVFYYLDCNDNANISNKLVTQNVLK